MEGPQTLRPPNRVTTRTAAAYVRDRLYGRRAGVRDHTRNATMAIPARGGDRNPQPETNNPISGRSHTVADTETDQQPERWIKTPACPAGAMCMNGRTPARAWVAVIAELAMMLDDDHAVERRGWPIHPYFASIPSPRDGRTGRPVRPSPDIAEFGEGLAGRPPGRSGHDATDRWRAEKRLIEAAGLDPDAWGLCPSCGGDRSVDAYPSQAADRQARRCDCRSARDAADRRGHNHRVRNHGRCDCPCHTGRM